MSLSFQVEGVRIGSGDLFLIAGPCVIESEKHALFMAEVIKGVTRSLNVPFIFKASYDKANRTSMRSFRGPGLDEGLRILKKVKDEVHVPVLTDVHDVKDVPKVAEVVDVLQIPAFLCRQTDLIVAAAMTRARGQHQERPVRLALGHAPRRRKMPRRRQRPRLRHRARLQLRLQQPGRGHALAGHHAQICARGFRRHAFRATPLRLLPTETKP